jgi:hypothetical protein
MNIRDWPYHDLPEPTYPKGVVSIPFDKRPALPAPGEVMPTIALCEKINGGQATGDAAQGFAIIYLMGIGIFLIIGIACCK